MQEEEKEESVQAPEKEDEEKDEEPAYDDYIWVSPSTVGSQLAIRGKT